MSRSDPALHEAMENTACTHENGFGAVVDTIALYVCRCSDEGLERLLTAIRDLKYEREEMNARSDAADRRRIRERAIQAQREGWTGVEKSPKCGSGGGFNEFFACIGYPPGSPAEGAKQQVILKAERNWA